MGLRARSNRNDRRYKVIRVSARQDLAKYYLTSEWPAPTAERYTSDVGSVYYFSTSTPQKRRLDMAFGCVQETAVRCCYTGNMSDF